MQSKSLFRGREASNAAQFTYAREERKEKHSHFPVRIPSNEAANQSIFDNNSPAVIDEREDSLKCDLPVVVEESFVEADDSLVGSDDIAAPEDSTIANDNPSCRKERRLPSFMKRDVDVESLDHLFNHAMELDST